MNEKTYTLDELFELKKNNIDCKDLVNIEDRYFKYNSRLEKEVHQIFSIKNINLKERVYISEEKNMISVGVYQFEEEYIFFIFEKRKEEWHFQSAVLGK